MPALYMPITLPGSSVQTSQQILAMQNKIIRAFPEVSSVSTTTAP